MPIDFLSPSQLTTYGRYAEPPSVAQLERFFHFDERDRALLQAYTIRSAAWALEPDTGDPLAEQIYAALRHAPDGLTRTQLRDLLHRNAPVRRVDQALANLVAAGKADRQRILTTGRPAELWTAREA